MRKTLPYALLAAFCAILLAAPLEGGGVMLVGMRNAMLAGGGSQPSGYWGLCFTAEQANSTVAMTAHGSAPSVNLLYSTDAANWSPFVVGTTTVTLASVGDKVWLKAGIGGNTAMGSGASAYNTFALSGLVAASGNIMSLLDGENETYGMASYGFYGLFYGCSSLTTAPELPATTLALRCYARMFYGCTALTSAPNLPATTLADQCYIDMFRDCSSLASIRVGFGAFGTNCTRWLGNVAATGTFYCPTALGTDATITRGINYCPAGWTVINTDA